MNAEDYEESIVFSRRTSHILRIVDSRDTNPIPITCLLHFKRLVLCLSGTIHSPYCLGD
jgi:hypothetical protein